MKHATSILLVMFACAMAPGETLAGVSYTPAGTAQAATSAFGSRFSAQIPVEDPGPVGYAVLFLAPLLVCLVYRTYLLRGRAGAPSAGATSWRQRLHRGSLLVSSALLATGIIGYALGYSFFTVASPYVFLFPVALWLLASLILVSRDVCRAAESKGKKNKR